MLAALQHGTSANSPPRASGQAWASKSPRPAALGPRSGLNSDAGRFACGRKSDSWSGPRSASIPSTHFTETPATVHDETPGEESQEQPVGEYRRERPSHQAGGVKEWEAFRVPSLFSAAE